MGKYVEIKKEIEELIDVGYKFYDGVVKFGAGESAETQFFLKEYEQWYTKSLNLVKNIQPSRVDDFISFYQNDKRKEVKSTNYVISDGLRMLSLRASSSGYYYYRPEDCAILIYRQNAIIKACLESFDSKISNIQQTVQADIFDSEIDSARFLLKQGFVRASGAVCGVVLEKHLGEVCKNHAITISKKSPTIADYNEKLKDTVYDTQEWRRMQFLADIRNACSHNKNEEPTKEKVNDLIAGVDRVIKTIF